MVQVWKLEGISSAHIPLSRIQTNGLTSLEGRLRNYLAECPRRRGNRLDEEPASLCK